MLRNTKLHALLLCLLFYSSGCHEITHIILDDPIELNHASANSMVTQLALHQLGSLEETGKLVNPKDLGFPVGRINRSYTFEMQIKGKDFRIWATPKSYGRDGKVSYYFDTVTCRRYGKDKKGEKANSSDPVVLPIGCYDKHMRYSVGSSYCFDSIIKFWESFRNYYSCSQELEDTTGETELRWQSWYVDYRTDKDMAVWKLMQDDHK